MHSRRTLLTSLAIVALPSWAASNFVRVQLGQGASIEVPKNWTVLSENGRVAIDTFVEAKGFRQTESTLNFAAKVFDDRDTIMALVNARFYPDNTATQAQAKQLTASDIETIDAGIRKATDAPLNAMGLRMTHWYGSKMQVINGLRVYVHEHQTSGAPEAGPTRVRGLRVWASPRSFTVTLSYRERDATLLLPIINYMASTIRLE
jgi:hypothetical protein